MTAYAVQRIRRTLEESVERIDRENITHWLMMFAAKQPIRLHHPRMGEIAISGVTFYGSVIDVYDRYVLLVIDDLIAETTQTVKRRPKLTPYRRPILTPLASVPGLAARRVAVS